MFLLYASFCFAIFAPTTFIVPRFMLHRPELIMTIPFSTILTVAKVKKYSELSKAVKNGNATSKVSFSLVFVGCVLMKIMIRH